MIRAEHLRTGDARQRAARVVKCVCMLTAAGVTLYSAVARGAEKPTRQQPQPWVTISLGSLGVPSMPSALVKVGASMLTLDLVDDTHVLLTFSSRGLVPRVPGDPPDDDDRMVTTELVELPSGRILATKDWHMHDHGRYLWRIGKGRYMMRSRHTLYVITPRALMGTADPLKALTFPSRDGLPAAVTVSPDESMLTVETVLPPQKADAQATDAGLMVEDPKPQVMLDFYRMTGGDETGQPLRLNGVGLVRAPGMVMLPMDADGYLWEGDPQRGRWPLSFNEFGGKEVKIGAVDSSCAPRLQMVSRFEFLAFTCMGTDSRTRMKAYGMDGHETWEDSQSETYGMPEFAFAPAAGRFAMSRISSLVPEMDDFPGAAVPDGSTQEVRVYQTESGDLLLKAPTSPVTRFAENFDLSEDGLVAAVVNDGAIQVYKLAPPSKQDVKDLEAAKSFSPPVSAAAVSFAKMETPVDEAHGDVAAANAPAGAGARGSGGAGGKAAPAADVTSGGPGGGPAPVSGDVTKAAKAGAAASDAGAAAKGAQTTQASGDATEETPRKAPTLLGPGETVETVKGSGQPK
jgi:hypothetical protein